MLRLRYVFVAQLSSAICGESYTGTRMQSASVHYLATQAAVCSQKAVQDTGRHVTADRLRSSGASPRVPQKRILRLFEMPLSSATGAVVITLSLAAFMRLHTPLSP